MTTGSCDESVNPKGKGNGWLAVRCVGQATETGGIPFAHTGPWHVQLAGAALKPRRFEVAYFLQRVEEEIARNQSVLTKEQLSDYYQARDFWRTKLKDAIGASVGGDSGTAK